MTPENRAVVLPRFFHCSRQEAQAVSAEMAPTAKPAVREIVTAVRTAPTSTHVPAPSIAMAPARPVQPLNRIDREQADSTGERIPPPSRDASEALTGDLSRLHLTVSRELLAKLEAARLALSHARPGATLADVIEVGVELVLARDAKKKALVAKPRAARDTIANDAAHVPAEVRRQVWKRDGGCCRWPLASGGICGSRLRVEIDHVIPRALGGASTVENLRVLCRVHNDLAARLALGDAYMDGFTFRRATPAGATPARHDSLTQA